MNKIGVIVVVVILIIGMSLLPPEKSDNVVITEYNCPSLNHRVMVPNSVVEACMQQWPEYTKK